MRERGRCRCGDRYDDDGCDCCGGGCCCDCCCGGGFRRRYQTKAEQTAELEAYLRDLEAEVQAVEERLKDLKRKR